MPRVVVIAVICLLSVPVSAAPADSSGIIREWDLRAEPLPEVTVTAERLPHSVRDVSASVSIVTGIELERTTARTATAALAGLPGVFVQQTGAFGRTDIDIRGTGDRGCRVAVLVDGRPEKMSLFGCTVTHTLPMNSIERIEVVRGPQSVLYGSDALAGVVNIITRSAERPLEAGARLDYGSFNTRHGTVTLGTRQERFHALGSFDKAMSDGHLPNSQYNGNDASLRAGWDALPNIALDFTGKYFTGVKHEPNRSTDPETLTATAWNRYDRGGLDLTAAFTPAGAGGGFAKVFRTFGEHRLSDGWHSTDHTDGIVLHGHIEPVPGNLAQAGIELSRLAGTWIQSESVMPAYSRLQAALFVQDEQRLGPFVAVAGARMAYDQQGGLIPCPKLGLVWQPGGATALRANVSRGFRYAPFNYTALFPPKNPNLKPEVSWNYELGLQQGLPLGLTADIAGFILEGTDLIETGPNPNPPPPVLFVNSGSFSFRGAEIALDRRAGPIRGHIAWTLTDYGVKTRARAGSKLNLGIGSTLGRFDADAALQYVSRYFAADSSTQAIPSYLTLDARLGVRIVAWLDASLSVANTLDNRYDTYADLPGAAAGLYRMPGRSFSAGLSIRKP